MDLSIPNVYLCALPDFTLLILSYLIMASAFCKLELYGLNYEKVIILTEKEYTVEQDTFL